MTPSSVEKQMDPVVKNVLKLSQVTPMDIDDQGPQEKQQDEEGEMGQRQDEEYDERLVLTLWDIENLLKDITGEDTKQQGQEPTKEFYDQVIEKLEEYQQQLDITCTLQSNLAQQMLS